jgi:hypothetical protein
MLLGDLLESALGTIGVTSARVEAWLGRPCGCDERRERLNALDRWARRFWAGHTENARSYLEQILGD